MSIKEIKEAIDKGTVHFGIRQAKKNAKKAKTIFIAKNTRDSTVEELDKEKIEFIVLKSKEDLTKRAKLRFRNRSNNSNEIKKMAGIIDMKTMRYINLFAKISRVATTKCFMYNGQVIFAVPEEKVSAAIGKGAANIKKLKSVLGKKVKVVAMPNIEDKEGIKKFIIDVVNPIEFSKADIKENSIVITAGRQSKAALIGRNRTREKELSEVLKNFFKITQFRIA